MLLYIATLALYLSSPLLTISHMEHAAVSYTIAMDNGETFEIAPITLKSEFSYFPTLKGDFQVFAMSETSNTGCHAPYQGAVSLNFHRSPALGPDANLIINPSEERSNSFFLDYSVNDTQIGTINYWHESEGKWLRLYGDHSAPSYRDVTVTRDLLQYHVNGTIIQDMNLYSEYSQNAQILTGTANVTMTFEISFQARLHLYNSRGGPRFCMFN